MNFGGNQTLVSVTFPHRPDKAILFWHSENMSAIQLFSLPEKIEELFLFTIDIKQNEKPTPT